MTALTINWFASVSNNLTTDGIKKYIWFGSNKKMKTGIKN